MTVEEIVMDVMVVKLMKLNVHQSKSIALLLLGHHIQTVYAQYEEDAYDKKGYGIVLQWPSQPVHFFICHLFSLFFLYVLMASLSSCQYMTLVPSLNFW